MNAEQYKRSVRADRHAWRDEMPQKCMHCGRKFVGFRWPEIHEIERKSQAPLNWWHRCNGLVLCNPCHSEFGDARLWPHARQLALKRRMDPTHFDLKAWLQIKPRPSTYVTEKEIDQWSNQDSESVASR